MCDYCGCRSHRQIASLSAEHDVMLELLDALVRSSTLTTVQRRWRSSAACT